MTLGINYWATRKIEKRNFILDTRIPRIGLSNVRSMSFKQNIYRTHAHSAHLFQLINILLVERR